MDDRCGSPSSSWRVASFASGARDGTCPRRKTPTCRRNSPRRAPKPMRRRAARRPRLGCGGGKAGYTRGGAAAAGEGQSAANRGERQNRKQKRGRKARRAFLPRKNPGVGRNLSRRGPQGSERSRNLRRQPCARCKLPLDHVGDIVGSPDPRPPTPRFDGGWRDAIVRGSTEETARHQRYIASPTELILYQQAVSLGCIAGGKGAQNPKKPRPSDGI